MKATTARDLKPLFNPKSIAIIGASERGFYPSRVLSNLLHFGYKGDIYPVNPRHDSVMNLKSYPKVVDINEDIDLAVIVVPRGFVVDILKQCERKGVKAAIIITAGFGEADEWGKKVEEDLASFVKESEMIICGPNCAGSANIRDDIILTARFEPSEPGNVAFISQSGALMMALYGSFLDKQVYLSHMISTGNQIDLGISESMRYLIDDENIRVIAGFIEGVKNTDMFLEAADAALEKEKPIILLKIGKTKGGVNAAITHTGSITGSDAVYDAVFKQKGIIRVDDVDELIDTVKVFSSYIDKFPKGKGIGIITQSGGLGSLTADLCEAHGLDLPELSGRTLEEMLAMEHLLTFGIIANPADVRGAGTRAHTIAETINPMMHDEKFDVIIILLCRPAVGVEDLKTVEVILDIVKRSQKPIFVVWVGRKIPSQGSDIDAQPYRALERNGVPTFHNPQACVKAVKNLIYYSLFLERSKER